MVYAIRIELVDPGARRALLGYLRRLHVPDLLRQRGFRSAELRALDDGALAIEYRVASLRDLKFYFNSSAPALRADFQARFGDRVRLSRSIARPIARLVPAPLSRGTGRRRGATR